MMRVTVKAKQPYVRPTRKLLRIYTTRYIPDTWYAFFLRFVWSGIYTLCILVPDLVVWVSSGKYPDTPINRVYTLHPGRDRVPPACYAASAAILSVVGVQHVLNTPEYTRSLKQIGRICAGHILWDTPVPNLIVWVILGYP